MDPNKTPPNWRRPEDVMRLHKLRLKKRSLDFRMCDSSKNTAKETSEKSTKASFKKNPFKRFESNLNECKRTKFNAETVDDPTADGTLFRLLNFSESQKPSTPIDAQNLSFTNALSALTSPGIKKDEEQKNKSKESDIFVDWTLRVKVRLMSTQPYPWNQRLKTCEEASGITGYVRCIDTDTENGRINLDTSFNARFHQCCLVWQHPSIPWMDVYPRIGRKTSGSSVISVASVKDKLYKNWLDSFRSLFQLVRAKQCPYFYMITNTFVCLFRAAGLNGYSEINASVSPTTRGFRQLLKDEDIEFTMPLKNGDHKSPVTNDCSDTGYESVDTKEENDDDEEESNPIDDDEETDSWLQSMGMAEDDIKKLNTTQLESVMGRERLIDESPESLVFVEGVEAQALFNFLVNCKSITATSGSFAGVPPTLLSPVAFTGATLTPLKVRESEIRQNGACYHSMEITGPLLPHTIHNLCDLMKNANLDKFTLTFANVEPSKPFTRATSYHIGTSTASSPVKTPRTPSAFDQQNLSDCGLKPKILSRFCRNEVRQYDSIKYSDSHYSCS